MSHAGTVGKWVAGIAIAASSFTCFSPRAVAQVPTGLSGLSPDASVASPVPEGPSASPFVAPAVGGTSVVAPVPVFSTSVTGESAPAQSVLEVIRASIFDDIYSPEAQARWTPLSLGSFFSEGWNTPFVLPTSSTNGVPRQGWVNAFGGQFFRAWFFAFAYDQGINSTVGNGYLGQYTIFVPFNRRFEIQLDYQFIVSSKGGANNTYHGNTGDTFIYNKFQLSESKNFGQLVQLGVRVPTGVQSNANGISAIWPEYQFWWNPVGKWVVKGETGVIVPTNSAGAYTQYQNRLALGYYLPGSQESWFQQWWFYVVASQTSTLAGTPRHETAFTLLPGIRCRIPGIDIGTTNWYFFASVNVPMTGPQSFSYQPIFAILYDY